MLLQNLFINMALFCLLFTVFFTSKEFLPSVLSIISLTIILILVKLLTKSKTLIHFFMSLELLTLIIFFLLIMKISYFNFSPMILFLFLIMSVCEATLSISLLIFTTRFSTPFTLKLIF